MQERLQKLMSRAGLGSRRASEALIRAGCVTVNGRVATLGDKADPDADLVEVNGEALEFEKRIYIMLNKPRGVLSSTEDEMDEGRPTVRGLVDVEGHLYPVGRLDMNSEGLILLTNDGRLAHRLTHPSFEHEKVYDVTVEGHPGEDVLKEWRRGLMLRGKRTIPAQVEKLSADSLSTELRITMREGRKRQIRRVGAQLGHPVQHLFRRQIGPLQIGDLPSGHWRHLSREEVSALKEAVSRPRSPVSRHKKESQK